MANSAPQPPLLEPFLQAPGSPFPSGTWLNFLGALASAVGLATSTLKALSRTGLSASVGTTAALTTKSQGYYRLAYSVRITQAASTSSSLTVTLGWLETAVSVTLSGAAVTGNTTTSAQSGSVVVRADANSDLTYATTYASVGGTPMQYRIDVTAERLS